MKKKTSETMQYALLNQILKKISEVKTEEYITTQSADWTASNSVEYRREQVLNVIEQFEGLLHSTTAYLDFFMNKRGMLLDVQFIKTLASVSEMLSKAQSALYGYVYYEKRYMPKAIKLESASYSRARMNLTLRHMKQSLQRGKNTYLTTDYSPVLFFRKLTAVLIQSNMLLLPLLKKEPEENLLRIATRIKTARDARRSRDLETEAQKKEDWMKLKAQELLEKRKNREHLFNLALEASNKKQRAAIWLSNVPKPSVGQTLVYLLDSELAPQIEHKQAGKIEIFTDKELVATHSSFYALFQDSDYAVLSSGYFVSDDDILEMKKNEV